MIGLLRFVLAVLASPFKSKLRPSWWVGAGTGSGAAKTDSDATWRSLCRCGTETITTGAHLREGMTKSCGCLKRETKYPHTQKG